MFTQLSSPHYKSSISVPKIMRAVIFALVPGILVMFWLYGWGVINNIIICVSLALLFEAMALKLRNRPIQAYLSDYSAVLTAVLLALALPPLAPWWLSCVGIFFAIIVAKQLYGGLGYNPFNPAMVAYAILLISFPTEMTTYWQSPILVQDVLDKQSLGFISSLTFQLFGQLPVNLSLDALTSATPLDQIKTLLSTSSSSISEIKSSAQSFGSFGGLGVEWVNLAFLAGGIWLIYKDYIRWHIPLALLAALLIMSFVFGYAVDADTHPSPIFHLFSGATMLGAFFIATDPISAATTVKGRLIFGAGIGCLIYIIRVWGGFPDAIAFSVILMNIVVPLLDHYTQPEVYGHAK
ncbi:MAG: electron transport complex subunit RsxD [Pseudomonadota bacterium]